MSKKYVHKSVVNHDDKLIYTEIGPSPKGGIVFIMEGRVGREDATVLDSAYVSSHMIEYKEPLKGTVWVNIYAEGACPTMASHPSRKRADNAAIDSDGKDWRLACVEVPWVEGQGLETRHKIGCKCGCNEL